jgi:hypothetical protein
MISDTSFADPDFVRRTLAGYAQEYAGILSVLSGALRGGPADPGTLRVPLEERYRQLFLPPGLQAFAGMNPATGGAVWLRWQQAVERLTRLAGSIAADAGERLAAALADTGPGAPPVTTLRGLHALWIDCGEAAWSAAAHGDEFAAAQAELLAALVELRAAAGGR